MDWVIENRDYETTRIVESSDILELKQIIQSKDVKCKVILHHCDPSFWLTKREITEKYGCITGGTSNVATGYKPISIQEAEEKNKIRPIADGKMVLVTITFTMPSKDFETIQSQKFDLTINYVGKTYNLWHKEKIYIKVPYTCGVYKIEGFDNAFNNVKLLNPHVTEKQFAYDEEKEVWDSNLTEIKLYNGDDGCINKITKYKNINSEKITVSLTLLSIDIKNNIEHIEKNTFDVQIIIYKVFIY